MIKNYVTRISAIQRNFAPLIVRYKIKTTIMEKGNIEIKEEILRKLEDIKNTTESLVVKVGHLQVDLFNYPPDFDIKSHFNFKYHIHSVL